MTGAVLHHISQLIVPAGSLELGLWCFIYLSFHSAVF